jgi:hypothetical protein
MRMMLRKPQAGDLKRARADLRRSAPIVLACWITSICVLGTAVESFGQSGIWQPPEPSSTERDWIKLTSGEWLNGELVSLYDKNLQFDSEDLDMLSLDWDDVAEVRSARILTYRFEDLGTCTGTGTMRDDKVIIQVGDELREFPRKQLILILEGHPREINFWSAKMSAGLVARSGNTDQADLNAFLQIRRDALKTRLNLKYTGNIGTVQGEQNIDNHDASATFDALIAAGFYVTPASWNYFKDRFQNIDYRLTVAAGVGYSIFRGGDVEWSIGAGGGYVKTSFVSVQEGAARTEDGGSFIPLTDFEIDITDDIELAFDYNAKIGVPDPKESFHHASLRFEVGVLGDVLDFDLGVTWDRVEHPRADADGNVPKRDDLRTSFGIGVEF